MLGMARCRALATGWELQPLSREGRKVAFALSEHLTWVAASGEPSFGNEGSMLWAFNAYVPSARSKNFLSLVKRALFS
jgi:hypothetical protein